MLAIDEFYEEFLKYRDSPIMAEAMLGIDYFSYQLDNGICECETEHLKSFETDEDSKEYKRNRQRKYYLKNKGKVRESKRNSEIKNRGKLNDRVKRYRLKNPEKEKAHWLVTEAIERGYIKRPKNCQQCQSIGKTHAHHDDYTKPLLVRFLCPQCHCEWHRKNKTINYPKQIQIELF